MQNYTARKQKPNDKKMTGNYTVKGKDVEVNRLLTSIKTLAKTSHL